MTIQTEKLRLVRGVPKIPGDTLSGEQGITMIDLVTGTNTGFSFPAGRDWQPGRPDLKGSQWNDNVLTNGRRLNGDNVTNVEETIELHLAQPTRTALYAAIVALQRFIRDAQLYFASYHQIEPVYIEWQALGAPGEQYALIYTIDMSITYNDDAPTANVTLVLEREPYWRPIPPGLPASYWYLLTQGLTPGAAGFLPNDLEMSTVVNAPDAPVQGNWENRQEYDLSVDNGLVPSRSNDWIDIDADLLPGDAPALFTLTMLGVGTFDNIYLSRVSKPLLVQTRTAGELRGRPTHLNAVDGVVSGDSDITSGANGVVRADDATATPSVIRLQNTGSPVSKTLSWGLPNRPYRLHMNSWRGRYNVFVRYTSNVDVEAQLTIDGYTQPLTLPAVTLPDLGGGARTAFYGQVEFPVTNTRQIIDSTQTKSPRGIGIDHETDLFFVDFEITVNTTGVFNCIDLVFVPIDEPNLYFSWNGRPVHFLLDNTGYFTHGEVTQTVALQDTNTVSGNLELRGDLLTLEPGRDNRLYLFAEPLSAQATQIAYKLWPLPRWVGVRDV